MVAKHKKYDPQVTPFQIFDLAKSGMVDADIAAALDISPQHFCKWKREKAAVQNALKQARKHGNRANDVTNFRDYVVERLPKHLKPIWEEINLAEKEPNRIELVEALLTRAGLRARQQLFLHALTANLFNVATACRMVNISRRVFYAWVRDDLEFGELIDEIQQIKKDFGEHALLKLIKDGDSKAVIFFNKSQNRDRGYGDHIEVNQTNEEQFTFDDLDLSLDAKREILQAMRAKKARQSQMMIEGKVTRLS